ncbi:MAG TPA: Si-specific NAD(P)(+) transhydrogenase, partial [Pirellulales bacterium]|nr:Si-specific NAD(P)(+) transhydrogenase [Pirellulales bacterium]
MSTVNPQHFDILVIGSGPGGEGAAMQAVKHGKNVAVIERFDRIGGGCTHWGTIPSKALRYAIYQMTEANQNPLFHAAGVSLRIAFPELRRTARSVIERQVDMRRGFYDRNRVPVVAGCARFIDPHTIEIAESNEGRQRFSADAFVIATGSRPYRPADVDFNHPRIFDSDTILGLSYTPQSITVYGAGVVGCEYTSMFRNLDCKVNLVNTRGKLLEFLDDEIIDALAYHLRDRGVLIRHGETYEKIEGRDDGVVLHLKSGKQLKTDILLWANGRNGNSDGMGLEQLGIQPDARGLLKINENYQTTVPHIYAVGDVIGFPSLASAAYMQGRFATTHVLTGKGDHVMLRDIPTGIYTSPEISSIGRTERELTAENVPYEIGHSLFKSLARAQITGRTQGMLKILFHRETLQILGIHCFGSNASEIIHIGQAIMSQEGTANSLLYFINTTFNYPT